MCVWFHFNYSCRACLRDFATFGWVGHLDTGTGFGAHVLSSSELSGSLFFLKKALDGMSVFISDIKTYSAWKLQNCTKVIVLRFQIKAAISPRTLSEQQHTLAEEKDTIMEDKQPTG